jgi:hypothetical protein
LRSCFFSAGFALRLDRSMKRRLYSAARIAIAARPDAEEIMLATV